MAVDWLKIKNDYINGGGSYRKLAEKYGVSFASLRSCAEREKWAKLKRIQQHEISTKTAQKAQEKISELLSEEMMAKARIHSKLVRMVEDWIDRMEEKVEDTGDFRRMVQSCVDLGILTTTIDTEINENSGVVELAAVDPEPAPPPELEEDEDNE